MRMGTFYNDMDTGPGMDDRSFKADLQSNSRIGATFTRDKLIGLYELGLMTIIP